MKELTQAKFSKIKGLHVTSSLVIRIFEAIFKPREGVLKYFRAGKTEQITASILWTSLQSLSVALKMKAIRWVKLEIVASELVNFMLTNTAYDSIETLEDKVKKLESQL